MPRPLVFAVQPVVAAHAATGAPSCVSAESREAVDGHHREVTWMSHEAVEGGPADVAV